MSLPRVNRIDFFRNHGPDFFEALSRCIAHELGQGAQRENRWARLTPAQQGVYELWCFWAEVENGGLAQYFYNHTNARVPALEELLRVTGCVPAAELLEQATGLYRKHKKAFAVENPFGVDGLFSRMTELTELNRPVERLLARNSKRLEKWIRANIALIAVGDDGEPIEPNFSGTIETHHPGGPVFEQAVVRRGRLTGPYRRYFEDGVLEYSCYYKAGKISADYWPSGQPQHKRLKRGKLTVLEWYYPSGKLQKRYVTDKTGFALEPVRLWYENGQLAEEAHIKNGDKLGPRLKFFEDGSPRLEAEYRKGEKRVIENAWDDQRRQVVKNGDGTFFDDGRRIDGSRCLVYDGFCTYSQELHNGILHGMETTWLHGVLYSTQEFANGKPHGLYTHFYDNGRVRSKAKYADGKALQTEDFPKFDDPRPAVLLEVKANAELYQAWRHPLLDGYPVPRNLEEVQAKLVVPAFLNEVFERNKAGNLKEQYENLNEFDDSIGYLVMVNDRGIVDKVDSTISGFYCAHLVDLYPPIIEQLTFEPGLIRGRPVRCRVFVKVRHTFVEGISPR
jgi:antitoxin component YwqK of YwqJK toxin-antitoxin module